MTSLARLSHEAGLSAQRHYQRRYRARKKQGVRLVTVPVPPEVVGCLIADHWLRESDQSDGRKIADAIDTLLDAWLVGNLTSPK